VESRLSIEQHCVTVSQVSVNKFILRLRALHVRGRDEQRLGHRFALNRIEGRDVDAFSTLIFNTDGT